MHRHVIAVDVAVAVVIPPGVEHLGMRLDYELDGVHFLIRVGMAMDGWCVVFRSGLEKYVNHTGSVWRK